MARHDNSLRLFGRWFPWELLRLVGVQPDPRADGIDPVPLAGRLSAEPIEADLIFLLANRMVHIEVETDMSADMPWRLLAYRGRIRSEFAKYRHMVLMQHVLVLRDGSPPERGRCAKPSYDVHFEDPGGVHLSYRVHMLRNMAPDSLLADPATSVFAPLAKATRRERAELLGLALGNLGNISDAERARRLRQLLVMLAGLRLDDATVSAVTRRDEMPIDWSESSVVQVWAEEEKARGRAEGRAEGVVRGMLMFAFGSDPRIDDGLVARVLGVKDLADRIRAAADLDDFVTGLDS